MRTTGRAFSAKKRRSRSRASAASSLGSTTTTVRLMASASCPSTYPRAAPKRPRTRAFRAPSRKAAISSASAVGLPFGRCARKSFTVCVVSKAHDRLRAGARGGGGSCKRRPHPVQLTSTLLPPRRRARLPQLGEDDLAPAYHPAHLHAADGAVQFVQPPPPHREQERIVLAAGEGQFHPIRQGAGGAPERQGAALDDRPHSAGTTK